MLPLSPRTGGAIVRLKVESWLEAMGADVNLRSWPAAISIVLTALTCAAPAQEALVLGTYTCAEFLSDVGDRGNSAKVRRSLMMISWAAGYAAARQADASASLEVIAATLGEVCRSSPAEKAVAAITDKINGSASREALHEPPPASPAAPAPSAPAPPPAASAPSAPPAASTASTPPAGAARDPSFIAYSSRDMVGGDYHKQRGISQDQCENLCKKDSRCRAYSYDVWNRFCFLKSSVNPLRLEPRSVTFVASGAAVTYDESEPVIQRRPQKAFPNESYLQANAQSYGDCSQRCLKDKRCEAFNFYQSSRRCNLIEKPKEYSDVWGAEIGIKVQVGR
jgi:PAN domain